MKKSVLMFVMIAVIALSGQAQTKPTGSKPQNGEQKKTEKVVTPEQKAQAAVDKLDKQVTLTADQKASVKELALTKLTTVEAVEKKYKGQPEKKDVMAKEMQEAKKAYNEGVKKLLTPEQLKKKEAAEKPATTGNNKEKPKPAGNKK